jgi:rare lipoprotein A (peptidoglycan hydrolase)
MLTITKKIPSCAALLCLAALGAWVIAAPASAAEGATSGAGATAAPSGGTSAPSEQQHSEEQQRQAPSLQEGVSLATWFGPGLFGRHTACGQLLTKHLIGVANRTLPCGTLVDFSYQGRQLTVPVVDRGPYSSIGADWDLTQNAARLLKVEGVAKLDAKIVGHVQNSPELGQPTGQSASHKSQPTAGATGGVQAS